MKVLIFDTETTGLLPKEGSLYASQLWPYIVQFSFVLYDTVSNKIDLNHDFIIKIPKNVSISKESTNVHGITKSLSNKRGYDIKDILEIFKIALDSCDFVVGHNVNFDKKIVMVEAIRNKVEINFSRRNMVVFCTMQFGVNLCNIERLNDDGETYKKYPSLLELHYKLFGVIPTNLHNSHTDVLICLRCFYKMIFNDDLYKKNRNFKSMVNSIASV